MIKFSQITKFPQLTLLEPLFYNRMPGNHGMVTEFPVTNTSFPRFYVKNRASLSVPCAGFREPVQPEARRAPNKSRINYAGHAKHVVF